MKKPYFSLFLIILMLLSPFNATLAGIAVSGSASTTDAHVMHSQHDNLMSEESAAPSNMAHNMADCEKPCDNQCANCSFCHGVMIFHLSFSEDHSSLSYSNSLSLSFNDIIIDVDVNPPIYS